MTSSGFPPEGRFNPCYIPAGTSIGKYVVRTGIGRGGGQMAYLAVDPNWNPVVLKVSLAPRGETGTRDRMMHERFTRQVQYFLQLRDVPGVAHVYEWGMHPDNSENGYPYLVQEWVWGGTNIVDWFRAKPRSLEFVARGWMYLASACGAMERRGICHRDLKPENILMSTVGIPKIVDFDSGMSIGAAPLTGTGPGRWCPGTRAYFSPELCQAILTEFVNAGRATFTYLPTCDLHALGVIFYQILTGEHPFDENTDDEELFRRIAYQVPRLPRTLNPEVPFPLEKVTMKLLRKNPKKRYQTGDEVVRDLEALLGIPEDWDRPFQTPGRKWCSTSRPQSSHTRQDTPPLTPRPRAANSAAPKLVPSAIVLAGPRALAMRGPRNLLRMAPAPSALVAPANAADVESVEPALRMLVLRRARLLATMLVLALVVSWLSLRQHDAIGSLFERGTVLSGKATMVLVTAASMAVTACVELTGKVRTGDKDWLSNCSTDSRKSAQELEVTFNPEIADVILLGGPSVIFPEEGGVGLRAGPVEAKALLSTPSKAVPVRLFGTIRTGSDGASLQFERLRRVEDGREFPICAIATYGKDPGLPKIEAPQPPDLQPGFVVVRTGAMEVHFAY